MRVESDEKPLAEAVSKALAAAVPPTSRPLLRRGIQVQVVCGGEGGRVGRRQNAAAILKHHAAVDREGGDPANGHQAEGQLDGNHSASASVRMTSGLGSGPRLGYKHEVGLSSGWRPRRRGKGAVKWVN